jgi:hypothetical protein
VIVLDLDSNLETVDCDLIIGKLSEIIARWNTLGTYSQTDRNCQHFVDEILASLDISPTMHFKGQLGEFLKNLRAKGQCASKFHLNPTIREKLLIKEEFLTFSTHKELDEFYAKLETEFPTFSQDYKDDFHVLCDFVNI